MADLTPTLRLGEIAPFSGTVTADSGTLTILPSPGPTVTLIDSMGTVAGGVDQIPCDSFDSDPAATVSATFSLDPQGLGIAPGTYTLVFTLPVQGTDTIDRTRIATLRIRVASAFDRIDPSDVTTLLTSAGIALPATADPGGAIDSAIALLTRRLNRSYTPVTETRRINGTGTDTLILRPCTAITAVGIVAEDDTALYDVTTEDYVAEPWDQPVKTILRRIHGFPSTRPIWPRGRGVVAVTATWGETMPAPVAQAIVFQAALLLTPGAIGLATGATQEWQTGGPEGTDRETYRPQPWRDTVLGWKAFVDQTLRTYRRLTL